MSKVIKINELQANRVFLLNETNGVNNEMFEVADKIAKDIAFNALNDLFDNEDIFDDWVNDYDETYRGSVEHNGSNYSYEIFYDSSSNGTLNGETDGDCIGINYKVLENIFIDNGKKLSDVYFDEEGDNDFNVYEYCENARDSYIGFEYDVYNKVYTIALHELTHTLDKESDPMDRLWIRNTNRFTEEDVRGILYLFSTSEMNARISSAASILINKLRLETSGSEKDEITKSKNEYFYFKLMEDVLNDNELRIDEMQSYINLLSRDEVSEEYLLSFINGSKPLSGVYSIVYQVAINEDKLYKRSNPRQVLKLYASNIDWFKDKVVNFYENLLERYKKRIYKVCWHVFNTYSWNFEE